MTALAAWDGGTDHWSLPVVFAWLADSPQVVIPAILPPKPARRRRKAMRGAAALSLTAVVLAVTTRADYAQSLDQYFPAGLTGYNDNFTTVTTRRRSEYDPLGIRFEGFTISPEVSQSIGYDSNPVATARPHGAGISDTEASVTATSNWSEDSAGLFAAVDSQNYLGLKQQSNTNFRLSGTGQLDFGADHANLAASYFDLHETADQLNAISTQQPLHYTVTDLRASYLYNLGNLALRPSLDLTAYRFDNVVIAGQDTNQGFRSRDVAQGGVTASYAFAPGQSAVVALNLVRVNYTDNPLAQSSRDSSGGSILAGIDYSENDIFRYRLLGGVELRTFDSRTYKSHTAPIVQADVVWTATTLTTVTGRVARAIEDASDESQIGYTDTQAQLTVDHEYARNLLLQGRLAVDHADYLQGGTQATLYSAGGTVTYLINRNLRLSLSSDVQVRKSNIGNDFVRDITLLRVQAQL